MCINRVLISGDKLNYKIKINTLPALSGDCFIIEFSNGTCIMIDGGHVSTYNEISLLLKELNNNGKELDLLIITHIDQDHIAGARKLLQENGLYNNSNLINIKEIWFNGLMNFLNNKGDISSLTEDNISRIKHAIAQNKMYLSGETGDISAKEAIVFESLAKDLGYHINNSFSGSVCEAGKFINIGAINIEILSPTTNALDSFWTYFINELAKIDIQEKDISSSDILIDFFNWILINTDNYNDMNIAQSISHDIIYDISEWNRQINSSRISPCNRASISVKITYEDIVLIFTGDSDICDYAYNGEVNLIKLSHHGSYNNNIAIIDQLYAKHYIVSTNGGKYSLPNTSLISKILMQPKQKNIHFNYPINKLKLLDDTEQQKKYAFTVTYGNSLLLE
jgi:Zn-dependent hydrolases, including glyoxylases